MIVIGDSIAAGQYYDGPPWPELIGAVNKGVSNDTTRLALERFPEVQQSGASKCIIQFGHNDANRWQSDNGLPRVSRDAFGANIVEMIWRCHAFKIIPVICTITPTLREGGYNKDLDDYNRALVEAANTRSCIIIDVRRVFLNWGSLPALLLDDGLHLSKDGHELYANIVRTALS